MITAFLEGKWCIFFLHEDFSNDFNGQKKQYHYQYVLYRSMYYIEVALAVSKIILPWESLGVMAPKCKLRTVHKYAGLRTPAACENNKIFW